ncbi:MAG: patatin-like phospholipase family protein [Acidimicrobiales bacterium]|nr:patatin-like phospholipase family protein [Acidimicrobiales bacterium]
MQVGMLHALLEAGIWPDLVVGSSVGAINGAYLAGHASLEGVEQLAVLWESIRRRDVFPLGLRAVLGGILGRRAHFADPLGLRTLILRAELGFGRVEEAPVPFYPVATDLATGDAVVLREGDVVEALLASAAIPGVFPPVEIRGRTLVDGGVVADSPLAQAEALGATTIYLLPTASAEDGVLPGGAIDVAARALFLSANQTAEATIATLATRLEVHVVPPPAATSHSIFEFGQTTELIDGGYLRALAWLEDRSSSLVA